MSEDKKPSVLSDQSSMADTDASLRGFCDDIDEGTTVMVTYVSTTETQAESVDVTQTPGRTTRQSQREAVGIWRKLPGATPKGAAYHIAVPASHQQSLQEYGLTYPSTSTNRITSIRWTTTSGSAHEYPQEEVAVMMKT